MNAVLPIVAAVIVFPGHGSAPTNNKTECIKELEQFGFSSNNSGFNNLRYILPTNYQTKLVGVDCSGLPSYKRLVNEMAKSAKSKSVKTGEYFKGYYEHLVEFCETDDLMQTIEIWCSIKSCSDTTSSSDEFTFESDADVRKYFQSIAKRDAQQNKTDILCTLSVCRAEIDDEIILQKRVHDVFKKGMNLTELHNAITPFVVQGYQKRYVNNIFKFISRRRFYLVRSAISFCAVDVCYSELVLAGFKERNSGVANMKDIVPNIKSNKFFHTAQNGYAIEYLKYLEDHFKDFDENNTIFDFDGLDERKYKTQNLEKGENCIIGLDVDSTVKLFSYMVTTLEYAEVYGLPLYDWCLVEVCRHQLSEAGFVHDEFHLNWRYIFAEIDNNNLKFEFAIKYYKHIERMFGSPFDYQNDVSADAIGRGALEWCKFTVLWY